jgi:hypothetical protein
VASNISPDDHDLLVRTIIPDAAGKSDAEIADAARAIVSRVGTHGDTVSDVVLGRGNYPAWETAAPLKHPKDSKDYVRVAQAITPAIQSDAPEVEDILGNLVKSQAVPSEDRPLSNAKVRITVTPRGSQGAPVEDVLGDLIKGSGISEPTTAPAVVPAPTPGPETLPQATNRFLAGAQGDTAADRAIRFGGGMLRGVGDVADTLAQGIAAGGESGANVLARMGIISPESASAVQDWRTAVNRRVAEGQTGYTAAAGDSTLAGLGRMGGEIAGSAPLLAVGGAAAAAPVNALTRVSPYVAQAIAQPNRLIQAGKIIAGGAGVGGGASALTSSTSDMPIGDQLRTGALTGAALGPAGYGLGKVGSALSGAVSPKVAQLAQRAQDTFGLNIGVGQMSSSPMVRFLDSVMQRMPFSGYATKTAEQQKALNSAIAKEMGVNAEEVTPDVVQRAKNTAYTDYDVAKANLGTLGVDRKFYQDLYDIHQGAHYSLEESTANVIDKQLQNVADKLQNHTLDPDLYQSLTRKGGVLDKAISSKDPKISGYAGDIKNALEDLVGRNDPQMKALKDAADYKYYVASNLEEAAKKSPTGDMSPSDLYKLFGSSQTPAGELARIGKRFMQEPPSSGTAERSMLMQHLPQLAVGATGAGAVGASTYFDPESWQRNALLTAGGLAAGRYGLTPVLRGNFLAGKMINSGLKGGQNLPVQNLLGQGGWLSSVIPAAGAIRWRNALQPSPP